MSKPFRISPLALALALLPLLACSKASDADCERLAAKIVDLAVEETHPGEAGTRVADQARAQIRGRCLEDRPTRAQLECIVAVTDKDQIPDC